MLALAPLVAAACEHTPAPVAVRDPDPPGLIEERERSMACITLAEALYGASAPRQVISRAGGSLRMSADDESLVPLTDCLESAAREGPRRWPEPVVRSLANAYGAALSTSRMPADEVRDRLEHYSVREDVTLFWRARLTTTTTRERERLLRLALQERPSFSAASLALAAVLVEQKRADEAPLVLEAVPESHRPDLRAFVQSAALASRGERHQASALLEKIARGEVPKTAPNGPDALALRLLPAPLTGPLLCEVGRAHEAAAERTDALRVYRAGACFSELTTLHLQEGDAFSALLTSFWAAPEEHERALEGAKAFTMLHALLEPKLRACESLQGGARCDEHRARLEALAASTPPPSDVTADEDEIVRRALGVLLFDDDSTLLQPASEGPVPELLVRVPRALLRERAGTGVIELVGARTPWPAAIADSTALIDVVEIVSQPNGTRALVQALQLARDGVSRINGGLAVVEKTPDGWRAARFTREMALSPGGP